MSGPIPHWLVSMHEITLLTTKQNAACEIGSGDIKRSRAPCDRDRIYYSHSREVMDKLTKAVLHRYTVRLEHTAVGYKEPVSREVDPYKLWYVNSGLYLVGHDHRSEDLRVFAVERINSVSLTNRRFDPSGFDFEKFAQSAFGVIGGEAQEVEIRFSKQQAPYVRDRTWHPSQSIETEPHGNIILRLRVADWGEVRRWLIGFGADALVLKPAALRREIAAECARMSSHKPLAH